MSTTDPNLILAWEASKPVHLGEVHRALLEALCLRYVLEFLLEIPKHRREMHYDEVTGKIMYEISDTLSRKTFTVGSPFPFHPGLSSKHFLEDVYFATDLWFASSEELRMNIFRASFIHDKVDGLQQALRAKGFDCRRTSIKAPRGLQ